MIDILKLMPKNNSLFETVIVSANDTFVDYFLNGKIKFIDISKKILKFINLREFTNIRILNQQKLKILLI